LDAQALARWLGSWTASGRQMRPRPLIMGVLNVTPDSFSDGGRYDSPDAAVAHAEHLLAEGADLIDVGGESTRPGSKPVAADEQIRRTVPVIRQVIGRHGPGTVVVSIDTTSAQVARAALDAGAGMINDISAGRDDPQMLPLAATRQTPVILMHMLGRPATMQTDAVYRDVVAEVRKFLDERRAVAVAQGVAERNILLDPGIGFGKTLDHNLELLRRQHELVDLGRPLVVGTSRKRFIGTITGESEPARRVFGTAATVAWAVTNGAAVVRVHDVGAMAQVLRMIRAIQHGAAD
jgi:dihydropteroate synthase